MFLNGDRAKFAALSAKFDAHEHNDDNRFATTNNLIGQYHGENKQEHQEIKEKLEALTRKVEQNGRKLVWIVGVAVGVGGSWAVIYGLYELFHNHIHITFG